MVRQSPDRRNADDPDAEGRDAEDLAAEDAGEPDDFDDSADSAPVVDDATETFWAGLRIDPIEIALPTGSGFTLRAYRPVGELTPTEVEEDDEDDPFATRAAVAVDDDEDDDLLDDDADEDEDDDGDPDEGARRRRGRAADDDTDVLDDDEDDDALDDDVEAEADEDDEADLDEEDDVPVFLGHQGKLFLFRSPESLVEFVRSGAENDLAQLDSWSDLVARVRPEDIAVGEDDSYELDLVVENLRGGHDAWDDALIISAGEIARDVAYAYQMDAILAALSPGTPLDDLDEAARATVEGGLGSFFARRRLRKIGAQQATLGWRTIIGKISSVVVWRD